MGQIFISYSRADIEFVGRLHESMEASAHSAWVDWEGIEPSAEWMGRIESAIDAADAVVFVISPDSCASTVCGQELDHAIRRNKRLIPVLFRDPVGPVRDEIAKINWIFARAADSYEKAVAQLVTAIETDLGWVSDHTRLSVRAIEWDQQGRDPSFTLRGTDLLAFEDWFAKSHDHEPEPTVLQSQYLLSSRRTVTRRQRVIWASLAVGLAIATGLGTFGWLQSQERERQAEIAEARRLLSRAEALRNTPDGASDLHEQRRQSLRFSVTALSKLEGHNQPTGDADRSVRLSLAALPKWTEIELSKKLRMKAPAFDRHGSQIVFYTGFGDVQLWSTDGTVKASCPLELSAMQSVSALAVAKDNQVVVSIYNASSSDAHNRLVQWSMTDCKILGDHKIATDQNSGVKNLTLMDDGLVLARLNNGLSVWNAKQETFEPFAPAARILQHVLNPAQSLIAGYERQRGSREHWLRIRNIDTGDVLAEKLMPNRFELIGWSHEGLLLQIKGNHYFYSKAAEEFRQISFQLSPDLVSHDGKHAVHIEPSGALSVLNTTTGKRVAHDQRRLKFAAAEFRPDSHSLFVAGRYGVELGIWHFAENGAYATLPIKEVPDQVGFSSNGETLFAGNQSGRAVWRLPPQGPFTRPVLVSDTLNSISPIKSTTNQILTRSKGSNDGSILAEVKLPKGQRALLVSAGSTRGGTARRLEIWKDTRKTTEHDVGPVLDETRARQLIPAQNGNFVFVGTRAGFQMFHTEGRQAAAELFHADAQHAGVSSDGQWAVTVDQGRQARIWDISKGTERVRLTLPTEPVGLEPSKDGRWLAILGTDDKVYLMAIAPGDLSAQACQWLPAPCP